MLSFNTGSLALTERLILLNFKELLSHFKVEIYWNQIMHLFLADNMSAKSFIKESNRNSLFDSIASQFFHNRCCTNSRGRRVLLSLSLSLCEKVETHGAGSSF